MYYIDTQVDPDHETDLTDIARYYFVLAEILFDAPIDGEDNLVDAQDQEVPTMVFLQVMTTTLDKLSDADEPGFRDFISARIPYYHHIPSLSTPLSYEFINSGKYQVLIYNGEEDAYELQSYESVFVKRFKPEKI